MARRKPVVLSTRATEAEAALVQAAAKSDGKTINNWALPVLLREARQQINRQWSNGAGATV
jgi:uncharacterized protein (DUF1778 family)